MDSLYREDGRYTANASVLDEDTTKLLTPVFKKFLNAGYSPREISHIMSSAISMLELEAILLKDVGK